MIHLRSESDQFGSSDSEPEGILHLDLRVIKGVATQQKEKSFLNMLDKLD